MSNRLAILLTRHLTSELDEDERDEMYQLLVAELWR